MDDVGLTEFASEAGDGDLDGVGEGVDGLVPDLFEESFCRTLIDLGYQDTVSREQEVRAFFEETA